MIFFFSNPTIAVRFFFQLIILFLSWFLDDNSNPTIFTHVQDKQVLLEEHETNWKQILNDNPDELKVHFTHLNTKLVNILNEKCQLTRKVNILLDNKNKAQSRVDELEDQMTNTKEELTRMAAQHDRVKVRNV